MSSNGSQVSHANDPRRQVTLWIILDLYEATGDPTAELWKACLCPLATVTYVSWILG